MTIKQQLWSGNQKLSHIMLNVGPANGKLHIQLFDGPQQSDMQQSIEKKTHD